MRNLHLADVSYVTTIGSDVTRDCFFCELSRVTVSGPVLVAEAIWSDSTNDFVVNFVGGTLPFSVLESFIAEARSRVPPAATPTENNHFREQTLE
jgi:hypothetical protein